MRKTVLKTISLIMGIVFLLGMISIDSDSYIPVIMCMVSIAWFIPFLYANNFFEIERR